MSCFCEGSPNNEGLNELAEGDEQGDDDEGARCEGEISHSTEAFRPIGLIRHHGCPNTQSGDTGQRPGRSRRVNCSNE